MKVRRKMRFFHNIKKYQGYAIYAAKAQLKSEVAASYLNWIWWILEPLLTMMIYILVFGYIFQASEPNYTVFLFLGILMWNFFSGVVKSSISVVKNNRSIISRVYVPKYILLISLMYQYAFKFAFGMLIEFFMMLVFQIKFSLQMLSAIPFFMGFFLFAFSCSTVLQAGVLHRAQKRGQLPLDFLVDSPDSVACHVVLLVSVESETAEKARRSTARPSTPGDSLWRPRRI